MYVIYLDESGDPNAWSKQNHFIIGGIAIHEGQIRRLSNVLDDVQAEFFPGISVPLKFHAVDINSGRDRFRSICKSVRQRMLETVNDEIAKTAYPNAVLFATAMHISSVRHAEQALRDTFQDIAQRINTFLLRFHHQGTPQKGLLIIDRSQSTESRYRILIADFRGEGTEYGYLDNIVDIPYFSQSSDSRPATTRLRHANEAGLTPVTSAARSHHGLLARASGRPFGRRTCRTRPIAPRT